MTMELFLEWLMIVALGAALAWQIVWSFLLDRWIAKWAANDLEQNND